MMMEKICPPRYLLLLRLTTCGYNFSIIQIQTTSSTVRIKHSYNCKNTFHPFKIVFLHKKKWPQKTFECKWWIRIELSFCFHRQFLLFFFPRPLLLDSNFTQKQQEHYKQTGQKGRRINGIKCLIIMYMYNASFIGVERLQEKVSNANLVEFQIMKFLSCCFCSKFHGVTLVEYTRWW